MKVQVVILSDVTQTQRNKLCMFSLRCRYWLLSFRTVCLIQNIHRGLDNSKRLVGKKGSSEEGEI